MEFKEIESWSNAVDLIEDENADRLPFDAPPLKINESWTDPEGRVWKNVFIAYGAVGGRWCYWKKISIDGKTDGTVVVDKLFNGWSAFFAGMLRVPYDGQVFESLMLTKGVFTVGEPQA